MKRPGLIYRLIDASRARICVLVVVAARVTRLQLLLEIEHCRVFGSRGAVSGSPGKRMHSAVGLCRRYFTIMGEV